MSSIGGSSKNQRKVEVDLSYLSSSLSSPYDSCNHEHDIRFTKYVTDCSKYLFPNFEGITSNNLKVGFLLKLPDEADLLSKASESIKDISSEWSPENPCNDCIKRSIVLSKLRGPCSPEGHVALGYPLESAVDDRTDMLRDIYDNLSQNWNFMLEFSNEVNPPCRLVVCSNKLYDKVRIFNKNSGTEPKNMKDEYVHYNINPKHMTDKKVDSKLLQNAFDTYTSLIYRLLCKFDELESVKQSLEFIYQIIVDEKMDYTDRYVYAVKWLYKYLNLVNEDSFNKLSKYKKMEIVGKMIINSVIKNWI